MADFTNRKRKKLVAKIKADNSSSPAAPSGGPPLRPAEARLYEVAAKLPGRSVVVVSAGRAQSAGMLAGDRPNADVVAWFLDGFRCNLATESYRQLATRMDLNQPQLECRADWPRPEASTDLVLIEQPKSGEAELGRQLLQSCWQHLDVGGILVAATDNPKDRWLLGQLQVFSKAIKTRKFNDATVYYLVKHEPLKRIRDYSNQLAFRDAGSLIQLMTRPGVFAHRKLDPGARQLINAVDIFPESRIIEIGCGSGAVSMALAKREPTAQVLAIDSNARAIDCIARGCELNNLANVDFQLNFDGQLKPTDTGSFAMALCNPPYYADFRIAVHFIETALRALRPSGRVLLVTRKPQWYRENLPRWFDNCEVFESRGYHIATGVKANE